MASAPHALVVDEDNIKCWPYINGKTGHGALLKCSLETSCGGNVKGRKLDELQHVSGCRFAPQVEDGSDEESDQRIGGVPKVNPAAVNERLSALQQLLPHGLELDEDEVLRVAIEYVKELERQIQMFDNSSGDWSKTGHAMDDTPLQKRGLCIVPLSTLAKAL